MLNNDTLIIETVAAKLATLEPDVRKKICGEKRPQAVPALSARNPSRHLRAML